MKNHNDLFLLAMCTMCNCLAQIGLFSAQEKNVLMTLPKKGWRAFSDPSRFVAFFFLTLTDCRNRLGPI